MAKKQRKTSGKYLRTTITVPAELKAGMDKIREPVNWSQLAAEAFARKLDELATGPALTASFETMAGRLRANRWEVDAGYDHGWQLGRNWAIQQADLGHLVRLERLCRTLTDDEWLQLATSSSSTVGDLFLLRLCPELYRDSARRESFWNGAASGSVLLADISFVKGFFEAALDAWLWVKDDVGSLGWWCPRFATGGDHMSSPQATERPQTQEPAKVRVKRKARAVPQQPSVDEAASDDEAAAEDNQTKSTEPRQREQHLA